MMKGAQTLVTLLTWFEYCTSFPGDHFVKGYFADNLVNKGLVYFHEGPVLKNDTY